MATRAPIWAELRAFLEHEYGPLTEEWAFYGQQKSGLVRKTTRKQSNLFVFTPRDGYFRLGFVFGDRAVAAVEASGLPGAIKEELRCARKYPEGRVLAVVVKWSGDFDTVKKLIGIQVAD